MFIAFNSTKLPPLSTSKHNQNNKKIKNINIQKLTKLINCNNPNTEEILSDDEIYLNQLIEPHDLKMEHDDISNDDDEINLLEDQSEATESMQQQEPEQVEAKSLQTQHQSNRPRRSSQVKKRKNRKRNIHRRKYRYRRSIIRPVYHHFPKYLIRKILRLYNIDFTHVKTNENNDLVIGLRKGTSKQEAEHNLSMNMFSKNSYLYYRKLYGR